MTGRKRMRRSSRRNTRNSEQCKYKRKECKNQVKSLNSKLCQYHSDAARLRQRRSRLPKDDIDGRQKIEEELKELHKANSTSSDSSKAYAWKKISTHVDRATAIQEAQGYRPGYEFGIERGAHKSRPNEGIMLLCRGDDCKSSTKSATQ